MSTATISSRPHPAQFADLHDLGCQLRFKAGEPIFQAGDDADHWFYVVKGVVRLSRILLDGRRHVADFRGQSDLFGFETDDVYEVTAEAVTDVVLMRYRRRDLEAAGRKSLSIQSELLELTRAHVARLQNRVLQLGCQTARERVAALLVAMANRRNGEAANGCAIELPMTRQDIGDYLGLTTETISRTLGDLKRAGTIRVVNRTQILLNDVDRLEQLADGDEDQDACETLRRPVRH